MKVTFLHNGYESLAIEALSASLKAKGFKTSLVIDPALFDESGFWRSAPLAKAFSFRRRVLEELKREKPDLLCFSVFTDNYQWALGWATEAKKELQVPVIFGGIHPTSVPERVIEEKCVDFVCVGEGDLALPELTASLIKKANRPIDNIWSKVGKEIIKGKTTPPPDPDTLPFADKDIFYSPYPLFNDGYLISASRGCPFSCAYCANSVYEKLYGAGRARKRSPSHVLRELTFAKNKWRPRYIHFADEVFNWDPSWLEEFLPRYAAEIALPFSCFLYPDLLDDQTAGLLGKAGCFKAQLGMQTFDERKRLKTLSRNSSNMKIAAALDLLKKAKIYSVCDSILGLPGDTEADLQALAKFYAAHTPDQNEVFFLKYYPRTTLTLRATESGVLGPREVEELEEGKGTRGIISAPPGRGKRLEHYFRLLLILPLLPKFIRKAAARTPLLVALTPGGIPLRILTRFVRKPKHDFNTSGFVRLYLCFMFRTLRNLFRKEP